MTTQLQYGMEGERPYSLYYAHSGRTPLSSVLLAGIGGAIAAIIAAAAYAYLIAVVPSAKLRGMMPLLFGLLIGFVTARIAKAGKVRSLAVGLAVVGVVTFIAYYVAWVVWIRVLAASFFNRPNSGLTTLHLLLNPVWLGRFIMGINQNGAWFISKGDKEPVKGIVLSLFWIAEALCIFGGSLGVAYALLREEMFCEPCNRWCGKGATIRRTAPGDAIRLKQTLEMHNFSYLQSLEPTARDQFWEVRHDYCPACNRLHALSVIEHKVTRNKKGAVTAKKQKKLIERLLLDEKEAQALCRGPAPVAVAPPSPSNTPSAPGGAA